MDPTMTADLEKMGNIGGVSFPPVSSSSRSSPTLKAELLQIEAIPLVLPEKRGSCVTRYLSFNLFTVYRKIFAVVFFANLATLIALIVRNNGIPFATSVASATSANLMVALLFRQENFVNLVYEIAVCVPHALPLSMRRQLAKVFHYGGAHSGAGSAAVVWYILYTATTTKDFIEKPTIDARAGLITSYSNILLTMFCFILGSAHPRFRVRFHDHFEAMHRFAGWTALVTSWTHNMLAANAERKTEGIPFGLYLARSTNFWFLCISTSCTLFSWGRLRRREVYPEVLSDHAIRLHFKYKAMQPFYGLEWHAFATIPDEDEYGKIDGFPVVVSNAGDWTRRTIQEPPKKLWIRGYPLHGLLYTSTLFKRIVVVATSSGIGPCLSLFYRFYTNITSRRILWSTTYGPKITKAVLKADPSAIIPDMVSSSWSVKQRPCSSFQIQESQER